MGCVTSFLILAHVLSPLSGVLYTTHFLVKSKSKLGAFLQLLWGFVLVFGQHRRKLESTAFQLKQLSSLAASKKLKTLVVLFSTFTLFSSTCWQLTYGLCITKKLSRLLAQAGTHSRGLLRIIAHAPAPLI